MEVQRLAWLSGSWIGSSDGDTIDEHWSHPAGNTMMGMFRWLKEDALYLYEFLTIEPEGDSFVMRIKHFTRGGIGREAKDEAAEFNLEWMEERQASFLYRNSPDKFRRLIYRQPDANTLVVQLELDSEGTRVSRFHYQRA